MPTAAHGWTGPAHAGTLQPPAPPPHAAAECGLRPDAAASALRVSTAEAAIFALHAGNGRAHHRHTRRTSILKAADLFTSIRKDGDMKKVATIIYAVGWTQHTFGTQIIRTAAMMQLLLGNVGRAGGGVNALRGHSNIQGATDMAGLFDTLPGYLKVPIPADTDFAAYLKRTTPTPSKPTPWDSLNYWSNTPKFVVSLLKAMYGDAATKENGFAFDYLPKSGSQLFVDAHLGRHVQRQGEGHVRLRHERRDDRAGHQQEYQRAEESRLAGGGRNLSGRDQRILESAGNHCRRKEEHQDDGVPACPARASPKKTAA